MFFFGKNCNILPRKIAADKRQIEIAPNATEVIKNAWPTIDAPAGILKIDANNGAIVKPVINVNTNKTAKLTPGVCLTLGITKNIKTSATQMSLALASATERERIPFRR